MFLPKDEGFSIPKLDIRDSFLVVVCGALVTHLVYKKFEVQPSSYAPTFLLLGVTPYLCSTFLIPHFISLLNAYIAGFVAFNATLLASIAFYRLSPLHPLAKYPGPTLAKLSKWWLIYKIWRGEQHRIITALHKEHGKIVRVAPNELSFADADLLPALLAPDMTRGPVWDGRRNPDKEPNLLATRSSADHAKKRVAWNHAFSSAAIKDYQPAIVARASQLAEELEKRAGQEVNLVDWMSYFAFDFMGDMAFGGGFELMRDGDREGIWGIMADRIDVIAWQMHIPWATRMLLKLPYASDAVTKFRNFTTQCATNRKMRGSSEKDLFYYLNDEASEDDSKPKPSLQEIATNGELAVVAGSDTTSTSLSGMFYYLLTHRQCYSNLRAEVEATFPPGEEIGRNDGTKLAEMKYLNAVINEAMRLQPAVMTWIHRAPEKGTGGKWCGEHFISESTAVNVTPYVLHRDPDYFYPSPDSFIPERWIRKSAFYSTNVREKVKHNPAAFIPFSAGHANCAGKNLALAEMRVVLAMLMQKFDFRFADGYDPKNWEKDMVDLFVLKLGKLPVVITPRV